MPVPGKVSHLGEIMQLAYLPTDFEATLRYWTDTMGVGPFFEMKNIQLGDMRYRGAPSDARFTIAIAYWGDVQIELVRADNDGSSIYTGDYAVRDRLHHICIMVESIEDARRACAEAGAEIIVEGQVGEDGAVIYADFGGGPGHLVEMLQPMSGSEGLFDMIRQAARDWDGSEPLRTLS